MSPDAAIPAKRLHGAVVSLPAEQDVEHPLLPLSAGRKRSPRRDERHERTRVSPLPLRK